MPKENIKIIYEEDDNDNNSVDFNKLLNEMEKTNVVLFYETNYNNFTIKNLLLICEYYGFSKNLKLHKCNKREIIHHLIDFEKNPENSEIFFKRQNLWFFINELKNDKFMKKYVLW